MPSRRDLDPVDIPRLLPYVVLIDVQRSPALDFKFRLIGSEVQAIMHRSYHQVWFSEIAHLGPGNKIWDEYAAVVTVREPLTSSVSYVGKDTYVRQIRHCLMPLSDDGSSVNMLFVAVEIERR